MDKLSLATGSDTTVHVRSFDFANDLLAFQSWFSAVQERLGKREKKEKKDKKDKKEKKDKKQKKEKKKKAEEAEHEASDLLLQGCL